MSLRIGVGVVTLVSAVLLAQPGFGQGRSGSGTGTTTTGGTPGTTGSTGTTPPGVNSNSGTSITSPLALPPPIFINGRVMLDDGTAPTESVLIERVCSGVPHAEGHTDSQGYFGFQLGNTNGEFQDASESSGLRGPLSQGTSGSTPSSTNRAALSMGDRRFDNCDLKARLVGYRSQTVSLANRRSLDDPNVGTILLHRETATEGSTVSSVSLAAPKDALKAYEKGQEAIRKQKPVDALRSFQKAVELYPDYAAAWCEIGKIQQAAGQEDTARTSFQVAAKADPKFVEPYLHLALIASHARRWTEVAQLSDQAIRLNSFDYPQALFFNAVANYNMNNLEIAEKSARQAEKLDTRRQFPDNARLLGLILMRRGELGGAALEFRTYLELAPDGDDAEQARKELRLVEQMADRAQGKARQ